jgi:hypothetical protein
LILCSRIVSNLEFVVPPTQDAVRTVIAASVRGLGSVRNPILETGFLL